MSAELLSANHWQVVIRAGYEWLVWHSPLAHKQATEIALKLSKKGYVAEVEDMENPKYTQPVNTDDDEGY